MHVIFSLTSPCCRKDKQSGRPEQFRDKYIGRSEVGDEYVSTAKFIDIFHLSCS